MLKRWESRSAVLVAVLTIVWSGAAWAQPPTPALDRARHDPAGQSVLVVGSHKYTAQQIEGIIEALPPQSRAFYSGQGKSMLPIYLVKMTVLSDEARKQNLQADPQVQQAIENATEAILANAEQESIEKHISLSEQQLRQDYEQKKGSYQEVHIRHILIRTDRSPIPPPDHPARPPLPEPEARAKLEQLREQILKGADFASLAREYSEDTATASKGGDMGYITRQKAVPQIAETAYALSPGQVSGIIQTPYGLELIKVEDKRARPFSEVRQELETEIRKTKADEAVQRLIDQYNVVIDKQYFTANSPAKAASPSAVQ
jgi:peptidyl-prolyl cis-trans isomerase C